MYTLKCVLFFFIENSFIIFLIKITFQYFHSFYASCKYYLQYIKLILYLEFLKILEKVLKIIGRAHPFWGDFSWEGFRLPKNIYKPSMDLLEAKKKIRARGQRDPLPHTHTDCYFYIRIEKPVLIQMIFNPFFNFLPYKKKDIWSNVTNTNRQTQGQFINHRKIQQLTLTILYTWCQILREFSVKYKLQFVKNCS